LEEIAFDGSLLGRYLHALVPRSRVSDQDSNLSFRLPSLSFFCLDFFLGELNALAFDAVARSLRLGVLVLLPFVWVGSACVRRQSLSLSLSPSPSHLHIA
jgi:hypothetical protein